MKHEWQRAVPAAAGHYWARYRIGEGDWVEAIIYSEAKIGFPVLSIGSLQVRRTTDGHQLTLGGGYYGFRVAGEKQWRAREYNGAIYPLEVFFYSEPVEYIETITKSLEKKDLPKFDETKVRI